MANMQPTAGTDGLTLTPREQEIMHLLLDGISPKEIAFNMGISLKTVDFHKCNLYRKFGIQHIQELFSRYYRENNSWKELNTAYIASWYPIYDDSSTCNLTTTEEEIGGQTEKCIVISGILSDYTEAFSGVTSVPFPSSLKSVWTLKSFSVKALGDGNKYFVGFPTSDTVDGDFWLYEFTTVKDEIMTVTINVPDDLKRRGWSEKEVKFNQNNITAIHFQALTRRPFNLKFWDIKLYR